MIHVTISKLENWEKCDFKTQPTIEHCAAMRPAPSYSTTFICLFGRSFHTTLNAAKSGIRYENSIKTTPRFKWVDV